MLHNKHTSTRVCIWISVTPWRFTISPSIYYPTVRTVDGVLYFLHHPAHYLMTGPCYNHCGTCRQTVAHSSQKGLNRETLGWSHQYLSSDALGAVGSSRFPSSGPEALGAFSHSMVSQDSALSGGKKKKHRLDKKRRLLGFPACSEVLGAACSGVRDVHGSAEPLVGCTPWGRLSQPSARRHCLIKPVTNGQKVYCPCTAAYDPINHRG